MAAGLGFKTFNTGDVLSAADTNGYLMQGVLVFANAAARDAAITSPQEGQCCYLKDTDAVQTYSGSAWVGFDDSNAIQNSIVDAKGDIVTASASDTPARLAVGNNGETLVANSSTATGLAYIPTLFAGKNKIINGDMNIWQRGTSTTLTNNTTAFGPDRFIVYTSFSAGTSSFSRQTFTPGTAPVAGYESAYFARLTCGSTSTYFEIDQNVEDVRTLAGQTVTLSFWAKASGTVVITPTLNQVFGSGGSGSVSTTGSNQTLTTSWARYSVSVSLPSISGKTIGTSSYLNVALVYASGTINSATIDVWGVQLEAGSSATSFQTATGTLQGELAACQRYYFRNTVDQVYGAAATGFASSTTQVLVFLQMPVQMRVTPTALEYANMRLLDSGSAGSLTTLAISATECSKNVALIIATGTGYTAHRPAFLSGNNNAAAYVAVTAEL